MAKITTILFDFDGTLMDTNDLIISSWQHTFKIIEGKERPVSEIIPTFGEPLDYTVARLFPHLDIEEVISVYRSYHIDNFGARINLFPGMKELLASLKEMGYKLGLVTSRLPGTTAQGLEKYGIAEFFDAVVTAADTKKHKPDPEPILMALEKLDSKPQESMMIGDTKHDILCAKNAGAVSVLVGWAIAVPEESRVGENAPEHIIERAEDLFEIL